MFSGMRIFFSLVKTLLMGRGPIRFALAAIVGMAFSVAVILSTMGIMDGFGKSFSAFLKSTEGDVYFTRNNDFFTISGRVKESLAGLGVSTFSPEIVAQGFLIAKDGSIGVELRGVQQENLKLVNGIDIELEDGEIAVGRALAERFFLRVGDYATVVYPGGGALTGTRDALPSLKKFRIAKILKKGIYQKELRQVYLPLARLQSDLGLGDKVNRVTLLMPQGRRLKGGSEWSSIRRFVIETGDSLGMEYTVHPYWSDYGVLFSAVNEQKTVISIMLSLIVVVSIFNILAFIAFVGEKRAQEIFIFSSLGLSKSRFTGIWLVIIAIIWLCSILVSLGMVEIFKWALGTFGIFKLPADIYHMSRLQVLLGWEDYALVFTSVLAALLLSSSVVIWLKNRRSLLSNLRREFS